MDNFIFQANDYSKGISVIMPTYNQASFILAAVNSLFVQTYTSWELIIINDGSTDETEKVLAQYIGNPKIRYIRNQNNLGLGASLNIGIDAATHDLIAYLPSDDLYYSNHLQSLYTELVKNSKTVAAVSGVIYGQTENITSSNGIKSIYKVPEAPYQLVQVLHRKTEDRWLERTQLVTGDLDELFWNNLLNRGNLCFTKSITCEWVNHYYQHSKIVSEFKGGGIYTYKQYYNVKGPIVFKGSGNCIDESTYYKTLFDFPIQDQPKPLKILIVGELSYNPERIVAFEEKGHKLYGLWIKASGVFNSVAPFAFGNLETISPVNYVEQVRQIKPDVIYGLLNCAAVPLAYEVMNQFPDIPFIWHFKESPTYCKQFGFWNKLIKLFKHSDGQIYLNKEYKDWFNLYFDTDKKPSFILDGDLPKKNFFTDDIQPLLSEKDGEVHTVLPGRPYGINPNDVSVLANQKIHLHFYGDFHQKSWKEWIRTANLGAKGYLHVHSHCTPNEWVKELSQYDAGWLHVTPADNFGELVKANWNDFNFPSRMPTLVAAGLPLLHRLDDGHINAKYSLLKRLDIGVYFSSFNELGEKLRDTRRMAEIRNNVMTNRMQFTFDYHIDSLTTFFQNVIKCKQSR